MGRIFRERSFYLRGPSGVRHVTIRPWVQIGAVAMAALFSFWTTYATLNTLFKDQLLAMKARKIRQVRQQAAAREARLKQTIDELKHKLMLDQDAWLSRVDELRADFGRLRERQRIMDRFLSERGLARPSGKAGAASRQGALEETRPSTPFRVRFAAPFRTARQAEEPLNLLRRDLARLERAQIALLDKAARRAGARLARARGIYRRLGLDPLRAAARAPRGASNTGGPFIPVLARDEGAAPLLRRMNRIETILDEVAALQLETRLRLPVTLPLRSYVRITSRFGYRSDPFRHILALHPGIDFKAAYGAPVRATAPGVVTYAGWAGTYGRLVKIRHDNGMETRYAHMSAVLVRTGQRVTRGTQVGRLGNTGRSTGPHLHYEIRIRGTAMDPERIWKARHDISQIETHG